MFDYTLLGVRHYPLYFKYTRFYLGYYNFPYNFQIHEWPFTWYITSSIIVSFTTDVTWGADRRIRTPEIKCTGLGVRKYPNQNYMSNGLTFKLNNIFLEIFREGCKKIMLAKLHNIRSKLCEYFAKSIQRKSDKFIVTFTLYKHVIQFENFSAPLSRVEINNLSLTKIPPPLGIE